MSAAAAAAAAASGEPVVGAAAAHPPQDVVGGGAYVVQPIPVCESAALTQGGREAWRGKHNAGIEGEELSSSASDCAEGRTMRETMHGEWDQKGDAER